MSETDLEAMPKEIEQLLESERPLVAPPAGAQAAVLATLTTTLLATPAAAGGTAAGGAHTMGLLGKLLASRLVSSAVIFALGGAAGAGVHALARPAAAPARQEVPPSPTPALPTPRADEAPAKATPPSAEPRRETLAAERRLLETARAAVSRGQSGAAIEALEQHAQQYAKGLLAEEREALWVHALVGARRFTEARTKAAQFERTFPGSMLLPMVKASIKSIP
jgi:hypothetical protein